MDDGYLTSSNFLPDDPASLDGPFSGLTSVGAAPAVRPNRGGSGVIQFQHDPDANRRMGRNGDMLVTIFNSLLLRGAIYEASDDDDLPRVWKIAADISIDPIDGVEGEYTNPTLTVNQYGQIVAITSGTTSSGLTIGEAITGGRNDGSVLYEDYSGNLAITPDAGQFFFDPDGTHDPDGVLNTSATLYIGAPGVDAQGSIALLDSASGFYLRIIGGDGEIKFTEGGPAAYAAIRASTVNCTVTLLSVDGHFTGDVDIDGSLDVLNDTTTLLDLVVNDDASADSFLAVAGTDKIKLRVQANAAQSTDLTRWTNSTGLTTYMRVNKAGYLIFRKTSAIADGDLSASEVAVWFTDTAGATQVNFKNKDSASTVTTHVLKGSNTGDQTITLTGDVTGSGTSSFATTIANDAVTFAKMKNAGANKVLVGSGDTGSGTDYTEITLGTGLDITGTTLAATAGSGAMWNKIVDNDLSSLTGFTDVNGTWTISGGVTQQGLTTNGTTSRHYWNTIIPIGLGGIIECECQMTANTNANRSMGIFFGFDGTNTGAAAALFNGTTAGNSTIQNAVLVSHAVATLFTFTLTGYSINNWYKIRMILSGQMASMYIDGVLVGGASNALNRSSAAHYIGITTTSVTALFRNLKVWVPQLP